MLRRTGGALLEQQHVVVQAHHPVGRGPALGQFAEIVDRPGQGRGEPLKGLRGLHQDAQRHSPGDELGGGDEDRKDRQQGAIAGGEGNDTQVAEGLAIPAAADIGE
ncbi:hypothetical protein D3C80_1322150 [compost metagenome]